MAKKFNSKGILSRVLVPAATGAVVQVVEKAATLDGNTLGIGAVIVGAALPEFVKNPMVAAAGDALIAIGGYKLAEENDLAGMLGLGETTTTTTTTTPTTSGVGAGWSPRMATRSTTKVAGASGNAKTTLYP